MDETRARALDAALKCCEQVLCGNADAVLKQARKIEAYLRGKDDEPAGYKLSQTKGADGITSSTSAPWVGTAAALDS